jgi:hypothetical protein
MPLVVFDDALVLLSTEGVLYHSTNGTSWEVMANVTEHIDSFYAGDFVSNGTRLFVSSNGSVYTSADGIAWTVLGDVCGDIEGCSVTNLVPRAKKGVIAAATVYADDYTRDTLWVYKKHTWTKGAENIRTLSGMELINGTIYALQERGKSGYKNAIKTVSPQGAVTTVRSPRDGGLYTILSDHLALINYKDASYLTLVKY